MEGISVLCVSGNLLKCKRAGDFHTDVSGCWFCCLRCPALSTHVVCVCQIKCHAGLCPCVKPTIDVRRGAQCLRSMECCNMNSWHLLPLTIPQWHCFFMLCACCTLFTSLVVEMLLSLSLSVSLWCWVGWTYAWIECEGRRRCGQSGRYACSNSNPESIYSMSMYNILYVIWLPEFNVSICFSR